jgi:hypothetical protein
VLGRPGVELFGGGRPRVHAAQDRPGGGVGLEHERAVGVLLGDDVLAVQVAFEGHVRHPLLLHSG